MSEVSEYVRKITVIFETEQAAHKLFTYLCKHPRWTGVEMSGAQISIESNFNLVEEIWHEICDADIPDKVLSIQFQRIT